jgi:hypothetical protein
MKPFVYSMQRNRESDLNTWQRGCFDISYFKNNLKTKHRESAVSISNDNLISLTMNMTNKIFLAMFMRMKNPKVHT